jgi:hypothetical protein
MIINRLARAHPGKIISIGVFSFISHHLYEAFSAYNAIDSNEEVYKEHFAVYCDKKRTSDPSSRRKKKQNIDNLISVLKSKNDTNVANEVRLIHNHVYLDDTYDPLLAIIPILYETKMKNRGLPVPVTDYEEIACHYNKITTNLCYNYLLRNFHLFVYLKHMVQVTH